MNSL
ncbi:hypothetical protein D046_8398, partial [Vibrio parahaemolyticus V-223/04]|jgi:hypothetical protein